MTASMIDTRSSSRLLNVIVPFVMYPPKMKKGDILKLLKGDITTLR